MAKPKIPEGVAKHVKEAIDRLWQKYQSGELPYKPGDFIGQKYQVVGLLEEGGFGVVYLVLCYESNEVKNVRALKTFRDEYLMDDRIRELFRKEAQAWVDLERHAYLVRAYWVDEVSGRLYIVMEYIAPDEQGLNSLHGYLERQPPDLVQSLRWAIQFCYGMEYAYSKGIKCHGDVKPDNIMISDNTVKILDFGLARVVGDAEGTGWKVIGYTAPEGAVDERSDIYSFGVVLWQMTSGSPLPPKRGETPYMKDPLKEVVQRCLEKEPRKRYQTFKELKKELELLLKKETGEVIKPLERTELEAWELSNKGMGLHNLGHFEEAIKCFEKAIELDPRFAMPWNNKGLSLHSLGCFKEAIRCFEQAIKLDLRYVAARFNKGLAEDRAGRSRDAIRSYRQFIKLASDQYAEQIQYALQRLKELEGGKQ